MASRKSTKIRRVDFLSVDSLTILQLSDLEKCQDYIEWEMYDEVKLLLQGTTRKYRRSLCTTDELLDWWEKAFKDEQIGLLKLLVNWFQVPVADKFGLTPLYRAVLRRWEQGAMFLLRHGASIHKADQSLNKLSCHYPPFLHAVLRTGSIILLREVIQRGADINVLDLLGRNCLESSYIPANVMKYMKEEMEKANPLQEEIDTGSIQLDRRRRKRIVYFRKETWLVEGLIAKQHSQDPRKTMLLRGAWHVTKGDYASASDCWKNLCPPLGSGVDGSTAFESAWTGILHVNDRRLLEKGSISQDNELDYNTFALLVIAIYAPAGKKLFTIIHEIFLKFKQRGKVATSLDVMKHLITVRVLYKYEVILLVKRLYDVVVRLMETPEIPFSMLLDSVMIASRCLSVLTMDGSFSTNRGLTMRHDFWISCPCSLCTGVIQLFETLLRTMSIHQQGVSSSEEQLQCFFSHIKDFVSKFPWIRGENIFHRYLSGSSSCLVTNSSIKTLVALSAEAQGSNRHVNMPPHLSANNDGDTPLHIYAGMLSDEDLVEEGVLQCFLDHGAHLCIQNNKGVSVRDILVRRGLFTEAELLPSLQCLAAAAFMKDANLRERVHECRPQKVRDFLLDH